VNILSQLTESWLESRLSLTWSLPERHPVTPRR
jgi:hypothetical protein